MIYDNINLTKYKKEGKRMEKIIRQFWGKLIRQSTRQFETSTRLQYVTWGGAVKLPEW